MQKHVLIFDFDGTLADTFHAIVRISNKLSEEFQYKRMTEADAERMKDNTVRETIKELNVPLLKIPLIVSKAKNELLKHIADIAPVSGLKDTLLKLKDLDYTMGILTSNSAKNVEEFLKNHELQFFDFINTTSKIWSKDHILPKILETNNLDKNRVIYIGDEARDIEAARRTGIKVAAVTWGYNSAKTLSAHHPDYLINSPRELLELFSKLAS